MPMRMTGLSPTPLPLLALACALFLAPVAFCEPRSERDAATAVEQWLRLDARPLNARLGNKLDRTVALKDANGETFAHAVFLRPAGFVIVPAEDEVEPVIAFSPGTEFRLTEEHPLGALVLRDVAGRVATARREQKAVAPGSPRKRPPHAAAAGAKWRLLRDRMPLLDAPAAMDGAVQLFGSGSISDVRVDPFILSKWYQGYEGGLCYNYYTPNNDVCGCVATAMAQWMRYYQHPSAGIGTNNFSISIDGVWTNRNTRGGDGNGGIYSWANMPLDPDTGTTEIQRQAIGALCHDAGVAAHMQYSSGGSGAASSDALIALVSTFGYSSGVYGYDGMRDLSGTNLNTMVNPNMHARMPVMFGIVRDEKYGHAVLADGYGYNSGTMYHHINMGWGGSGDAWYNLPTIDPYADRKYTNVFECVYNVYTSGVGEIVSGRITNSAGAAITGVVVTARNETGTVLTAVSDARGIYAVKNVPSSDRYWVSAYRNGYTFTNRIADVGRSWNNTPLCGNVWGLDFLGTATVGPADPRSFAAWPGSASQIALGWQKNVSNDNVLVAWSATGAFGTPSGACSPGDPVPGGGTVLYSGGSTSCTHSDLTPTTVHHYRAWSFDANTNYSSGSQLSARTHAIYYVNDSSTDGDVWCPVAGDDTASGTASNAPKATVQAILDTYDLEPGDSVYVDTGNYVLLSNTVCTAADQGSVHHPVTIRGSPNGTVLDRNCGTNGACGLYLNCSDYMEVRDLVFTSGYNAVYLYDVDYSLLSNITVRGATNAGLYLLHSDVNRLSDITTSEGTYGLCMDYSDYSTLSNVTVRGAAAHGVYLYNSTSNVLDHFDVGGSYSGIYGYGSDWCVLSHCIVWNSTDDGITFSSTASSRVENCTIAYNDDDQVCLAGSRTVLLMTNCIVVASGSGGHCINAGVGACKSDYNDLYAINGAYVACSNGTSLTIEDWRTLSRQDSNSLSADPRFVDIAAGDFHLQSTAGSWHNGAWTADATNSPGIDTGSPLSSCASEPAPNGGRVNMGACGNTAQASKSADTDGDGLSDSYEQFRLGSSAFDADSDDDGMNDGDEIAAGTDPTNASSVFAIAKVAQPEPTRAEVRWYSVTNRLYSIHRATNLMVGGFTAVTNSIPATPPVNVYTDTVTGLGNTLFYRITTQP